MTLGWMNSSLSMNSAEAPGNWGLSSRDGKCCCSCLRGSWGERRVVVGTQVRSSGFPWLTSRQAVWPGS